MTDLLPDTARRSPLHDTHVAAGATFTDFAGWHMPLRYSSELGEHLAVRHAAGLFDLSHMGEVLVFGPEAGAALDWALGGPMSSLAERQAKYTLLLAENGGIIDDLVVYRTGADRYLAVCNASNRAVVADRLRERAAGFDAFVEDESEDIGLLALQGPRALEILQNLEGLELWAEDDGGISTADALARLRYYSSMAGEYENLPILVARTGYTGEDGFELYTAPERLRSLWENLLETGAGAGLVPAGLAARDTLRLEAGMPLYGHELGLSILPAQARLGQVLAPERKGDFVGRSAIESGRPADPASEFAGRVLVGIQCDGKRSPRAGYAVHATEESRDRVGVVTSGALSPTLGHPIALAYVDAPLSEPGTLLFVDVRGTRIAAHVTKLPFHHRTAS